MFSRNHAVCGWLALFAVWLRCLLLECAACGRRVLCGRTVLSVDADAGADAYVAADAEVGADPEHQKYKEKYILS